MQSGGVRLRGRWGVMVFNLQTWQRMLNLARNYGWQPGINNLEDYCFRPGQIVREADGLALAAALERALPDIPGHQAVAVASSTNPAIAQLRQISRGISLLEWFSGEARQNLEGFIRFCRVGGDFEISQG